MPVAGKGDSRRPLLTSKHEFELRDELWRCKDPERKKVILELLSWFSKTRLSKTDGLQID